MYFVISVILKIITGGIDMEDIKAKVLEAMRSAKEPVNAGKIVELSGLERADVDKAMKALKKEGAIVSPIRCKWEPANK